MEEFTTLFARIECILYSRLLCYRLKSNDTSEFILTPSYFVLGSLPYVIPEPDQSHLPLFKRYDLIYTMISWFWTLWWSDYFTILQKKEKWSTTQPNISVCQVILLKQPSSPFMWLLAIIESCSSWFQRCCTYRNRSYSWYLTMFATWYCRSLLMNLPVHLRGILTNQRIIVSFYLFR